METTYYLIVTNDDMAYGGYETLEEAKKFFAKDTTAVRIEKVEETITTVYERDGLYTYYEATTDNGWAVHYTDFEQAEEDFQNNDAIMRIERVDEKRIVIRERTEKDK